MSSHSLAPTTHSVELRQIREIEERLSDGRAPGLPRARGLGLTGAAVRPGMVDTVVARRAHIPAGWPVAAPPVDGLAPDLPLVQLVAAGSPTFPYIYGLFAAGPSGGDSARLLPIILHTEQLRRISAHYGLHHRWGDGMNRRSGA
ncbi:MAG: hypothetical protein ACXV0U_03740 [Kineosporiaceae bacterium]